MWQGSQTWLKYSDAQIGRNGVQYIFSGDLLFDILFGAPEKWTSISAHDQFTGGGDTSIVLLQSLRWTYLSQPTPRFPRGVSKREQR